MNLSMMVWAITHVFAITIVKVLFIMRPSFITRIVRGSCATVLALDIIFHTEVTEKLVSMLGFSLSQIMIVLVRI